MEDIEIITGLLECGRDITTQDFLRAMPDCPAQTVYSRIRALVQSGKIFRIARGVYRPGNAVRPKVEITPWMREVNSIMVENLEGVNNCIYEKAGNLYVEVCRPDIQQTLAALKTAFPSVTEYRKAISMLDDLRGYIIVCTMPTESPIDHSGDVPVPSVEKRLVDSLSTMDSGSQRVFQREFELGHPNLSTLYRYASRKGLLQKAKDAVLHLNKERITTFELIRRFFSTQPVDKAWIFGSFARGEERPDSDIDILVDYINTDSLSLLDISRIAVTLQQITGREIDLVENGQLLPFATESANRDKYLIYERASWRQRPPATYSTGH